MPCLETSSRIIQFSSLNVPLHTYLVLLKSVKTGGKSAVSSGGAAVGQLGSELPI